MGEACDIWGCLSQNLMDAGCTPQAARQYLALAKGGKTGELSALLARHRAALLDAVHENQRKIDCLDFLLYKLNKEND